MTLSAGMDIEISCPTATLSQSSIILSTRKVLPICSLSLTKSIDHVILGSDGITNVLFTRAGKRFLSLLRCHTLLQFRRPALSLPRALELFFYDVL